MVILRRRHVAVIVSLVAVFLTSCSPPPESPSASAAIKLKVSALSYLGYLPLFIAEEEGYFRQNGLDVELIDTGSGGKTLPLLAHGDIDVYAATFSAGLLNAINRGADIRIVSDKGCFSDAQNAYYAILLRRDLAEDGVLDDPSRLKGMHAAQTPGGATQYVFDSLLQSVGLSIDDLQVQYLLPASKMEAMRNGAIDIASAADPWLVRMLDNGSAVVWKTGQEIIPDYQYAIIAFGQRLLREDRDAGNRFMCAWLQAVRQYNQGKTDRNLRIAVDHTGLDIDLLKKMTWPCMRDDGRLNLKSILDFQNWCVEKGFQDRPVPADSIYDPAFVEYANAHLPPTP